MKGDIDFIDAGPDALAYKRTLSGDEIIVIVSRETDISIVISADLGDGVFEFIRGGRENETLVSVSGKASEIDLKNGCAILKKINDH